MSAHAKLSPSSAKRWITCTPSVALEATLPEDTAPKTYAEEGTAAHTLAEIKLKGVFGKVAMKAAKANATKFKRKNEWYSLDFERHVDEYVAQVSEIAAEYGAPYVDLEQRVEFTDYVPGGFGTADVCIISEPVLHIIDLKFGRGVAVDAADNEQLMLYALGAYLKYALIYEFETVRMTIIQPRLYETSTFELPVEVLLNWATNTVKPAAVLADKGEGEYVPSEDACRWCRAKAVCKARADKQLELAALDFMTADTLCNPAIAELLPRLAELKRWATDIEEYALEAARDHGQKFPGYKLVEGRAIRKWACGTEAEEVLIEAGFKHHGIYTDPEFLSVAKIEKLIGRAKFAELLGGHVMKPPGKPALVPEDDKRPEINSTASAGEDFGGEL